MRFVCVFCRFCISVEIICGLVWLKVCVLCGLVKLNMLGLKRVKNRVILVVILVLIVRFLIICFLFFLFENILCKYKIVSVGINSVVILSIELGVWNLLYKGKMLKKKWLNFLRFLFIDSSSVSSVFRLSYYFIGLLIKNKFIIKNSIIMVLK